MVALSARLSKGGDLHLLAREHASTRGAGTHHASARPDSSLKGDSLGSDRSAMGRRSPWPYLLSHQMQDRLLPSNSWSSTFSIRRVGSLCGDRQELEGRTLTSWRFDEAGRLSPSIGAAVFSRIATSGRVRGSPISRRSSSRAASYSFSSAARGSMNPLPSRPLTCSRSTPRCTHPPRRP